ncbi:hypothetical protein ACFYWP_36830 [Actinacidiphila glaucinigra]
MDRLGVLGGSFRSGSAPDRTWLLVFDDGIRSLPERAAHGVH